MEREVEFINRLVKAIQEYPVVNIPMVEILERVRDSYENEPPTICFDSELPRPLGPVNIDSDVSGQNYEEVNNEQTMILELDISRRLRNILGRYYFDDLKTTPVSELGKIRKNEFTKHYKVGYKALIELEEICRDYGIELKR